MYLLFVTEMLNDAYFIALKCNLVFIHGSAFGSQTEL